MKPQGIAYWGRMKTKRADVGIAVRSIVKEQANFLWKKYDGETEEGIFFCTN